MNIAQRLALIGTFFFLSTGWVSSALAWLEYRRIYWSILVAAPSGRRAASWQSLLLPSKHHPDRPIAVSAFRFSQPSDFFFALLLLLFVSL